MNDLLYISELDKLRDKIKNPSNIVIEHLYNYAYHNCKHNPEHYPHYHPFLFLITEDQFFLDWSIKHLTHHFECLSAKQLTQSFIYHPWTEAYPISRWLAYYDWVYDHLSDSVRNRLDEMLMKYAWSSLFPGTREKPFFLRDNQTISLAYASSIFGYFFGYKRCISLLGKEMYSEGISRVGNIIGAADASGYTSEGTLYLSMIGCMLCHFIALLEQTTGAEWFTQHQDPNGASPKDQIEMAIRNFVPKGLGLPWNDMGYSIDFPKMLVAYYAYRTGNPEYLYLLNVPTVLGKEGNPGWGKDDCIWTLLWLPNIPIDEKPQYKSWIKKTTAGHLIGPKGDLSVFQYWNKSGLGHECIRGHVNPNAIAIYYKNIPFMVDGTYLNCAYYNHDSTRYVTYGINTSGITRNYGFGTVAGHNVLHFDDNEFYHPETPTHGNLISYTDLGPLQRIVSDCTDFYRECAPDIKCCHRETILLEPNIVFVRDKIVTEKIHTVKWRMHLRPTLMKTPNGFRVLTSDMGVMQIIPVGDYLVDVKRIPQMGIDDLTYRLQREKTGTEIKFETLFIMDEIGEEIPSDINRTDKWTLIADPNNIGLTLEWNSPSKYGKVEKDRLIERQKSAVLEKPKIDEGMWKNPSYYIKLSHYIKNADTNFKRIKNLDIDKVVEPKQYSVSPNLPPFYAKDMERSQFWWYRTEYKGFGTSNLYLQLPSSFLCFIWVDGTQVPIYVFEKGATVSRELRHCVDLSGYNKPDKTYTLIFKIAAIERTSNPWDVDFTVLEGWGGDFRFIVLKQLPWYSYKGSSVFEFGTGWLMCQNEERSLITVEESTTDAEIFYVSKDMQSVKAVMTRNLSFKNDENSIKLKSELPVSLSYEEGVLVLDDYYRKGRTIIGCGSAHLRVIFNNNTIIRFFGESKQTIVLKKFKGFCIVNGKQITGQEDGSKDIEIVLDPAEYEYESQQWSEDILQNSEKTISNLYSTNEAIVNDLCSVLSNKNQHWIEHLSAAYVASNHYKDIPTNVLLEALSRERKEGIYEMDEEVWVGLGDYLPYVPDTNLVDKHFSTIGIRKPPETPEQYELWKKRWRLKAEIIYALANQTELSEDILRQLKQILFDPAEFRGVGNACITAIGRSNKPVALSMVKEVISKIEERTILERAFSILKIHDRRVSEL